MRWRPRSCLGRRRRRPGGSGPRWAGRWFPSTRPLPPGAARRRRRIPGCVAGRKTRAPLRWPVTVCPPVMSCPPTSASPPGRWAFVRPAYLAPWKSCASAPTSTPCSAGIPSGPVPAPSRQLAARVALTVPLLTQLGLASEPGVVAGFGPVDPASVERLGKIAAMLRRRHGAAGPDGFRPIRCWQHPSPSPGSARCSPSARKSLAPALPTSSALSATTWGDILFDTSFGPEYQQVIERSCGRRRREDSERSMLGITQGRLVQSIFRRLGLPDAILRADRGVPTTSCATWCPLSDPLVRVLRLADLFANGMLLASSGSAPVTAF